MNPHFAFLIVEPRSMFEEVKKNLLGFLENRLIPLQVAKLSPMQFIYVFFNSANKELIKSSFARKFIEIEILEQENGDSS